jgi:DNA-binding transcriptional LysR family regulator
MNKLPLNLIYLKYFCDAVKLGSVTASAKENFVTQSAISQGITTLEKGLGVGLITHQTNRFKVTLEGQLVFEKAQAVFSAVESLEEALVEEDGILTGKIDFACMHSFALALLPEHLKKVKRLWPKLHVNFRLAHTDLIKEMIRKGIIDFGIVLDNEDLSGFETFELYNGEYRLYTASKTKSDEDQLFILSEERIETNLLKKSFKKRYAKDMEILMEVSSWEIIANLTEAGIGTGFFPDYVALKRRKQLKPSAYKIDPIPYKIYAIYGKSHTLSKCSLAFLELLKRF